MKKLFKIGLVVLDLGLLSACDDAHVATANIIKASDNFEVQKR